MQANRFHTSSITAGPIRLPSVDEAKKAPRDYEEMSNDVLVCMAVLGDQEAREERLIREIMSVDNVSWQDAQPKFFEIMKSNRKGLFMATVPYRMGIKGSLGFGMACFPLIFHVDTVLWFNELYVTAHVPEAKDLETPLEVGGYSWGWMEPVIGQASFFLLCMQFARAQMENLGIKPYTSWFKSRRAARLTREYPQYNKYIIEQFSEGDPLSGGTSLP